MQFQQPYLLQSQQQMKKQKQEDQKGLFTFYREQEEEEDILKRRFKLQKKERSKKKSKKTVKVKLKLQNKPMFKQQIKEVENQQNTQAIDSLNFLKSILKKDTEQNRINKLQNQIKLKRIRTQVCSPFPKQQKSQSIQSRQLKEQIRNKKRTKIVSELSQNYNFLPHKEMISQHSTNFNKINEMINACHQNFYPRQHLLTQVTKKIKTEGMEIIQIRNSHKLESKAFLQKCKYLNFNTKSNLITNRQSQILQQPKQPTNNLNKNTLFINHLLKKICEGSEQQNHAYKILKETLKLPRISKVGKEQIHSRVEKSLNRDKIRCSSNQAKYDKKIKHSNSKHKQFYQRNIIAQLTQSQNSLQNGPTINLINLSKQYTKQEMKGQQWHEKKKIIKQRLGVEL